MDKPIIDWQLPEQEPSIIKVIGLGGGGGNAVNFMFESGIKGVDFIICNTDNQHLLKSPIPTKLQIGYNLTAGRGVGGNPEIGRKAALDSHEEIRSTIDEKTKMLFITSGMGGGTGSGAAPVVAKLAREMNILTVGIVTYPFDYEGPKRKSIADKGIEEMKKYVDALIIVYNERLMEMYRDLPCNKAFSFADNVCAIAAKGIAEIITVTGDMNVDFEDVKTIMKDSGTAIFGCATAEGEDRALRAVEAALHSPLLKDKDIRGAHHILLNISYASQELLVDELRSITDYIRKEVGNEVDIKLGHCFDENLGSKISVTIIATSFEKQTAREEFQEQIKEEDSRVVVSLDEITVPKKDINNTMKARQDQSPAPQTQRKAEQMRLDFGMEEDGSYPSYKSKYDEEHSLRKYSYSAHVDELEQKENIPAYIRKNVKLEDVPHSSENELSTLYLTDDPEKPELKEENAFLNPGVD